MRGEDARERCERSATGPELDEPTLLGPDDLYLFNEGTHFRLYRKLGAHPVRVRGTPGVLFAVWAPDAAAVSVVGDFNGWDEEASPLEPRGQSGVWEGFAAGARVGQRYGFRVVSRHSGRSFFKADPFAFYAEVPPRSASVIWHLDYAWRDARWMAERHLRHRLDRPMAIYEVHLGSWLRPEGRFPTYRELAPALARYAQQMGFTHVELLPVMEHPFYGSWGYQTLGYFAPTSRYGTPQDFMYLVDTLHRAGVGVVLDWVPSHFPFDPHGLAFFDGTHLYEHADPRQGLHPDWRSAIFNYGRHEVRAFLISSALFWLDVYHADGLRVDAVASMLYLDYSRAPGQWIPNRLGGRENLEAIDFLRRLNTEVYRSFPDVHTFAEESTAWPKVSRPVYDGGLGFGFKWDMGWMHDTLRYMQRDPVHRRHHHNELTFRSLYAASENFVLPLSHDEVVYGKGSLLGKMPGDRWQRFANLRLLLAYTYAQAGKKLLFMGGEIAQEREWDHERQLDWHLLDDPMHAGVQRLVRDLNLVYRREPALHEGDCEPERGLEWVDADDAERSIYLFLRRCRGGRPVLVALNFTPVVRHGVRAGVPRGGGWCELLNTDAHWYGGSGVGNAGRVEALDEPSHGRAHSVELTLPPLGALFLAPE